MPTTHVEPGSDPLLQEVANALWKSRKVVVVTGAGISTNSGIPDFRSENGLYSLIQAQFDSAQQQATAASTSSDVDASDASNDPRPAKRRRRAYNEADAGESQSTTLFPGLRNLSAKPVEPAVEQKDTNEGQPAAAVLPDGQSLTQTTTAEAPAEPTPSDPRPTTPIIRPPTPETSPRPDPHNPNPRPDLANLTAPFPSSPPSITLGTPRPRPRPAHLRDSLPGSSSPLSSPPPVMYDPYQESTTSSPTSSRSTSEEPSSVSTPVLSSQTSFASSRSSLPIMKGRDLFDAQIWACPIKTSVFYTFVSTLRDKVRTAEPTSSHRFVSVLRDTRKLVRCYTQNIDQLEERVGLSTSLALGAGSRYRFSAKAGRSTGAKASAKDDEEQSAEGESREKPQSGQAPGGGAKDDANAEAAASQPSQTTSDPSSTQDDAPSSTPSAPAPTSAPTAPNRGVECVFLHGSLAELRCFVCARTASWDEDARLADTLAGRQPTCPHCAGATAAREERGKRALGVGKLRPDIVLYGEDHPHAHLISPLVQHDLSLGPDMLLILGTSMRVHGLKVLVKEFAKAVHDRGGKVVFVNFTKPPESVWADIIDYWVQWDCDAWVSDLQERKPALWLAPDTALPEEEKQKMVKLSRRQSLPDRGKRKEGGEKTSKRGRDSSGLGQSQKREESGLSTQVEQGPEKEQEPAPPQEVPPAPAPPKPPREPKTPRERRLKADAKRPASVRDHKMNAAYLVWKIRQELRRVTGRSPLMSAASLPSPPSARPRQKRPRKSVRAAMESKRASQDNPASLGVSSKDLRGEMVAASSPLHPPVKPEEPSTPHGESSISAAVKSRKRKQTVAWRMIRGVETRVSLNEAGEPETPVLLHTPAVFHPTSVPKSRRLPPPTPTTPQAPPPYQAQTPAYQPPAPPPQPLYQAQTPAYQIPAPRAQPSSASLSASALDQAINAGFRETDRLIAQMQASSRSASPLCLPPLQRVPDHPPQYTPTQQPQLYHHHHHQHSQPQQLYRHHQQQPLKPIPMEPHLNSPGPQTGISANVGSLVAPPSSSMRGGAFFMSDPMAGWLGYPPEWVRQEKRLQEREQAPAPALPHSPWGCPDEQLRKEQEAAWMLSAMSGRG
ncbi:NAD-dependent histone deacetylase HST3 [Staphylotrichum tortipilum]|uniref:NAD-dependent histone deacetylase HST3 n=1 Tax=Staphylotrichum tortipilum TaxID=2831512 RepID=A0AAN6MEV4_9PEZI|nr:NAD-dependent histone deacetylase HST3 [Staphylotrichum longicolle]